jgi:hypothetical protein
MGMRDGIPGNEYVLVQILFKKRYLTDILVNSNQKMKRLGRAYALMVKL